MVYVYCHKCGWFEETYPIPERCPVCGNENLDTPCEEPCF